MRKAAARRHYPIVRFVQEAGMALLAIESAGCVALRRIAVHHHRPVPDAKDDETIIPKPVAFRDAKALEGWFAENRLKPAGIVHVEAAKADGRWEAAYEGAANMAIPEDFIAVLNRNPTARTTYDTLNRTAHFSIYLQLHTAKKPQTRQNRMARIIERLARGAGPS